MKEIIEINSKKENEKKKKFDIISVQDIEKGERVELHPAVKGTQRVIQQKERNPKETITRFDNKVFDPSFMQMHTKEFTYQTLREELIKTNLITDLVAEVNAGKEASIYVAHLNGAPLIVKSFRHQLTSHNRSKGNPQLRATALANREYYRLTLAFNNGMRVPTPARQINNTILMRFIGTNWKPAPQLRNCVLEDPEVYFNDLIEQIRIMYNKAKLIHGDLSEYNILVYENLPVIIDFPQAINMNLLAMRYPNNLQRNLQVMQKDILTICQYFEKEYNIDYDFQEIYYYIVGKDAKQENVNYNIEEIEKMLQVREVMN